MKQKITYCWTHKFQKLIFNKAINRVQYELFEKSIESASKFYEYEILVDDFSYNKIADRFDNVVNIGDIQLEHADDFKVHLIENYADLNIIVDPDIIFDKEINFNIDADVIVERDYTAYNNNYKVLFDNLINRKANEIFPNFLNNNTMVNIGFLKINNDKVKKLYIEYYKKLKKFMSYKKIKYNYYYSVILGQYMLTLACENLGVIPTLMIDNHSDSYTHYDGIRKSFFYKRSI